MDFAYFKYCRARVGLDSTVKLGTIHDASIVSYCEHLPYFDLSKSDSAYLESSVRAVASTKQIWPVDCVSMTANIRSFD